MVVNVEIKNAPQDPGYDPGEAVAALTAAAIDEAGWTERVIVSSFQPATLRAVQVADGRLALGALWGFAQRPRARPGRRPTAAGFRAVHPFVLSVDAELVAQAHAAGLAVNVWTVNADDDLRAMVAAGVDTVITDELTAALAVARRGRLSRRPGPGRPRKRTVTGRNGGTAPVHKDVGHERRRVRQADPRSGRPGSLDPDTNTLDRSGKLILDDSDAYGVEMALQLAAGEGDEVTLVSMAPDGETSGLRTGLAMGAAKAILISDDALAGTDALGHGQGAGGRHQAGQARPRPHRDRVDRRLHRHDAGPGGRAAGAAVGHLRQGDLRRRRLGQGRAPDRGGLRRGRRARCPPWSR